MWGPHPLPLYKSDLVIMAEIELKTHQFRLFMMVKLLTGFLTPLALETHPPLNEESQAVHEEAHMKRNWGLQTRYRISSGLERALGTGRLVVIVRPRKDYWLFQSNEMVSGWVEGGTQLYRPELFSLMIVFNIPIFWLSDTWASLFFSGVMSNYLQLNNTWALSSFLFL